MQNDEMPPPLAALFKMVSSDADGRPNDKPYDPEHFDTDVLALKRQGGAYLVKHEFTPGQIVRFKKDLPNTIYNHPKAGQQCIVIEHVPGQRAYYDGDPSNGGWGSRVDLCLGFFREGSFITIWFDSGYFELVP